MGGLISFSRKAPVDTTNHESITTTTELPKPSIEKKEITPEVIEEHIKILQEELVALDQTPCFSIYSQLTTCIVSHPTIKSCDQLIFEYQNCVNESKLNFVNKNNKM